MKMFKKSLIAASIASIATAAVAGSVASQTTELGLEGAVAAGTVGIGIKDSAQGNDDITVTVTTGADYIVNDVVEFYISGGTIAKVDYDDPSVELANEAGASASLNFLDMDTETGKIRFRVQGDNIEPDAVGTPVTLTLKDVAVDSTEFSSGSKVTARAQAVSSASAIGVYDASSAATVATVKSSYTASIDEKFDQTIDVNNSRALFTKDDDPTNGAFDQVDVTVSSNAASNNYDVTPSSIKHVISGENFDYAMAFDADEDGELSSSELCSSGTSSFVTIAASVTCSLENNEFTITDSGANTSVSLKFNAPGKDSGFTLAPQSFDASIDVTGSSDGNTVTANAASDAAAGSWDLNGASVYVPYMPYADGISQIVYVSNSGSQDGSIEVSAFDDAGNSYGPYDLGTASGNSITKITGALEDALAADQFTSGKLAFTVTVTAPDTNIEIYTGYNAGNDRGLVINSSNKD